MSHSAIRTILTAVATLSTALAAPFAFAGAESPQQETVRWAQVDLDFGGGSLAELINELSSVSGAAILTSGEKAKLSVRAFHVSGPLDAVLDRLGAELGFEARWVGEGVVLTDKEQTTGVTEEYSPRLPISVADASLADDTRRESPVYVFGYAAPQRRAVGIKEAALGVQETILADDIAEFPELNLAESLQRVPGVTITRTRGEGDRISLRGLGPEFTRVQINGMEVLSNSARDRGFEFNVFASELFKQVDVHKTYDVSRDEGGIGGTVNLQSASPFDFDDRVAIISAEIGSNSNAQNPDKRFTTLFSDRFETSAGEIGILGSVALSNRVSEGQDASTYRYRAAPLDEADISLLPLQLQAQLLAGEIAIPRGNRYRVSEELQRREGFTAALQWQPSVDLEITLSGLQSNYDVERRAYNLQTRGSDSFPTSSAISVNGIVYGPTVVEFLEVNQAQELTYGVFRNANVGSESTLTNDVAEFSQATFSGNWQEDETRRVSWLAGWSSSEHSRREDKVYLETFADLTLDYRGSARFNPIFSYGDQQALLNVAAWRAHEIDLFDAHSDYRKHFARLDLSQFLTPSTTLEVGASSKHLESSGRQFTRNDLLLQAFETGALDDDISQIALPFLDHYGASWIGVDVQEALRFFGVQKQAEIADPSSDFDVDEISRAAYVNVNWRGDLSGMPARALLGLRHVWYRRESEGLALVADAQFQPESLKRTRSDNTLLPAFSARFEPFPDFVLRLSASRNLTLPPFSAINPSAVIRTVQFQDVVAGNPDLSPYTSTSFDLYAERYWGTDYFAVGLFYKNIDDFVSQIASVRRFGELDLPTEILSTGQTENTPFVFVTYANSQDTVVQGIELAARVELGGNLGLPEGLGVSGNYTYADGKYDYFSVAGSEVVRAPFPGLSEHSANTSIWFDAAKWGMRSALAYRSDYVTDVQPGLLDEDSRGRLGALFIDLSAYFKPSPNMRFTLDVLNISGETEFDYSDSARRLTERRQSGTTAFIGVHYQF